MAGSGGPLLGSHKLSALGDRGRLPALSTRVYPILIFADYRVVPPAPASLALAKATDPARMRFHTIQKKGSSVVAFCVYRRGCRLSLESVYLPVSAEVGILTFDAI